MSAATAIALRMAPQSARQARLLRLANRLARNKVPGAPVEEADKLLWVRSHARLEADRRLSREEEALRAKMLPTSLGVNSMVNHGNPSGDNLFHFREYPMFPGEYIPPDHNALASVRDELRADLTAQSVKNAWLKISGSRYFSSPTMFYEGVDGLDQSQLADIVHALFPEFDVDESGALVQRILEALSSPHNNSARLLSSTITADALGLDDAPGHYTNFLEWMGRITSSKAFATENSIYQLCRRAFNREDVRNMFENFQLLSPEAVRKLSADSYSHFYHVLRDYSIKIAGSDTRHQIGVRIDPLEFDKETGMAFAYGRNMDTEVICMIRPNFTSTGSICVQGKPLHVVLGDDACHMERVLAPFDEAGLSYKEFDVYFILTGAQNPAFGRRAFSFAAQFALANAIVKLIPAARVVLKKAGYLSFDRRIRLGDHPGYLNLRKKQRFFSKRAAKGLK